MTEKKDEQVKSENILLHTEPLKSGREVGFIIKTDME
jgi:hypothetical protein